MGDVIEITSWPSHRNIFYKTTSTGLIFDVKGHENAAIGLARRVGNACDYWVVLGQNQRTWIKKDEGHGKSVGTLNIINNGEYTRFWLTWRSGRIQLGRYDSRNPIISYNMKAELNYVTFSSGDNNNIREPAPVHWRFELPPVLEKPRLKPVSGGSLQWVQADNQLPDGALIGGHEKETLYIIRAPHRGSLTPGKFVPSIGLGFISWGGTANEKITFEVLCGFDCTWVQTCEDRIPVGAVEGGYSEGRNREILYVGRVLYNGSLIPGKVQPSHRVCYAPCDDREIGMKKYEILVSPYLNSRCANRVLAERFDIASPPESDTEDEGPEFELPDNMYEGMDGVGIPFIREAD